MNKQQILNITGLTEKEFYSRYPDQESFCNDYPEACAQLAQAAEGIEVTGSLTSPEEIQKLGKAYGFRTDSNKNFQQDMYNYVAKNKPELFKESISKFGPANAGLTNYGSVQGYRPDAYIGPRVADMMGRLGTPQAPRQPQAPKYVEYSNANVRQQYDFNRGMQQKYVGSNVAPTPIPSQPAMPATFPGQQPVGGYAQRTAQQPSQQYPAQPFTKNPAGGWNIGPAQAPSQPAMPARQQAPAQAGQPQMSHIGPWHTNPQGEYTRYYTNTQGDMNPGVTPGAALGQQAYGGIMAKGGEHGGLDRWFAEKWVDVKTGKECGRQEGEKRRGYPACRPSVRVNEDTPKTSGELSSAEREKFKRSKTSSKRIGYQHSRKEEGGLVEDFNDYSYIPENQMIMASGGNVPTNPSLWSRAKAAAKAKYDVYPSAYANGFAAKWYKQKGGSWRKAEYGMEIPMMEEGGKPEWLIEAQLKAQGYSGNALEQKLATMANGGEPNGGMALGQMAAVVDKMSKLRKFVSPDQNLDPWIASKLAVMDHSADAISDYMMYNPEAQGEGMEDMMAYGGVFAEGGEQDETQQSIMAALKQGMKPQEILKKLVAMGLTKEQAVAYIKSAVAHPGSQYDNTYVNESSYNQMSNGGEPQNAGFQALPDYVQEKIMDNMAEGGELDMYGGGGYVVKRSSARKGKTHVVIGPDGTKKYFGDSNLGQHPKDPERKAAFYARHKTNLKNNPYFRAYARATWEEGGEIEDQGGGMFAYGGIHLDPAKKGTFKAQATRMGMSVQQAASHILANKEDYSPAMVKKANFAKNFAKEEGGQIDQYKNGGYIGMDGKFHMAKGSGTFSGNAYYANGGEEDPNLTAPYDGSNPNAPLPPFDPSAYQAMQLPTGYVGYSKKDPATGQFVPIDNVRKDDLWKHLSGSQRWNTGQTVTQKVGRAIGDVDNAMNYGIAAAGAYSNYLQNNERQNEYNKYMENMGTTASLYNPSAVGTSRGDYSVTGSSYGQLRPNQMGNFSWKGTTSGKQYGAYGGQTMYTIGGGVFDALLTDADASSPVVYNPLANMPSFRQPNAVDNTYVNQPAYKLKGLPGGSNNEDFGEKLASHESGGRYNALPWIDKSHTKLASSAAGKYQFLWNTHKDKIKELTGVSSKEQFLNSPDAQEAYFDYWDNNVLTPEATKLKKEFNLQLSLDKIKAAVHQAGIAGARKYFSRGVGARDAFGMDTGKYINQFQEGGIVEMSDTEIKQFLANGGQLEFLD
jgi:hypothetical protein